MTRRPDHRLSQTSLDALQALVGRRARFGLVEGVVWLGQGGTVVGGRGVVIEHWDAALSRRPSPEDVRTAYLSARWPRTEDQRSPARFVALARPPIGLRRRGVDTRLLAGAGARPITAIHVHVGDVVYEEWDEARFGLRKVTARQDRRLVFAFAPEGSIAFEPFDGVDAARVMAMNGAARPAGRVEEELRLRLTLH
jgi:hypothetical protein